MMEAAVIQRGKGIDDLVKGYTPNKVEVDSKVETTGENKFAALLKNYEAFLGRYDEYKGFKNDWVKNCIHNPSTITDILTPDEINQFLQTTITYEDREKYDALTGIFITRLIQNSYNAGNNDFQLDTRSLTKNLNWLGAYLEGKEKRKLHLSITGDVGDMCGEFANNSTFNITGDIGDYCGVHANNSTYTITGNVGDRCGEFANYSTFNITGNVGDFCGSQANDSTYTITGNVGDFYGSLAKNSTYTITGNVGDFCGSHAKYSTFKTSNKKTLEKLQKYVYRVPGNTIIYMNPDGSEKIMRI